MDDKNGEATREDVARRAYEISQSADAGTPEENWHRAERELRESHWSPSPPKRARAKKKTEDPVGS